jgi:quercetin dioxygenase-like cupin family protein
MKRNSFLKLSLSVFTLVAAPLAGIARNIKKFYLDRGFKIKSGEGRYHGHLKLKGVNSNIMDVKISGKDTNGDLAIFEQTSLSPGRGVSRHIHPLQDEVFYVIEGSYFFEVGGDKHHLTTGDSIFLPRAVPHAWIQASEKGKMIVTFQPAGKMEAFFVQLAALDHEPGKEEIAKIFEENEMQVVGPPLKAG